MTPSGLFTMLRRMRSEARTPEHTYRSFLFSKIVHHIDDICNDLGTKWPVFAEELKIRLEPITLAPTSEVSTNMLNNAADAVVDQCKGCPDIAEFIEGLLKTVDDLLPNLSLPSDWRVKQDLLTHFHRLYDWLLKEEGERQLLSDSGGSSSSNASVLASDSRSSSNSSASTSGGNSNGGECCPEGRSGIECDFLLPILGVFSFLGLLECNGLQWSRFIMWNRSVIARYSLAVTSFQLIIQKCSPLEENSSMLVSERPLDS
jgi:hypothetical protein